MRLSDIEPKERALVMDLVRDAGIDVSDWANFRGGAERAASNPKYCYEWSYIDRDKVVVLNLWHGNMEEQDGVIFQRVNLREHARRCGRLKEKSVWERRATNMDVAIQAASKGLPVRVIVCSGTMRNIEDEKPEASKVRARMLDPIPWAVTSYNWETGEGVLTRGGHPESQFADQFSVPESEHNPKYRDAAGRVAIRSAAVRKQVLTRASGECEFCGKPGFTLPDGQLFLETHHVVPLADGGADTIDNVVGLCPNHHREAHYGVDRERLREALLALAETAAHATPPAERGD